MDRFVNLREYLLKEQWKTSPLDNILDPSSQGINSKTCSVQGARKILPDPLIGVGFHSFLCSDQQRPERIFPHSEDTVLVCTSVQCTVQCVPQLRLFFYTSRQSLENVINLRAIFSDHPVVFRFSFLLYLFEIFL